MHENDRSSSCTLSWYISTFTTSEHVNMRYVSTLTLLTTEKKRWKSCFNGISICYYTSCYSDHSNKQTRGCRSTTEFSGLGRHAAYVLKVYVLLLGRLKNDTRGWIWVMQSEKIEEWPNWSSLVACATMN